MPIGYCLNGMDPLEWLLSAATSILRETVDQIDRVPSSVTRDRLFKVRKFIEAAERVARVELGT
jgi:hypothetical protein